MIRVQLKCAALLLAIAAVLALPTRSQAQATNPLLKELDTIVETKHFQAADLRFKEFLGKLCEVIETKHKRKLEIVVDVDAFKEVNPEIDEEVIYDSRVKIPSSPSEITVDAVLRTALARIPTRNATYVVLPGHILITTDERTTPAAKLREKVRGTFDKRTLSAVLAELSQKLGISIVIDNRCGEKAETKVSATFMNDTPLAGALRVLTEMADLKVVVLDGVILVTTPAHYDALRKEYFQKAMALEELRQQKEKSNVKYGGAFGLYGGTANPIPGTPGFPTTPIDPNANPNIYDPLWPFSTSYVPGYTLREPTKGPPQAAFNAFARPGAFIAPGRVFFAKAGQVLSTFAPRSGILEESTSAQ